MVKGITNILFAKVTLQLRLECRKDDHLSWENKIPGGRKPEVLQGQRKASAAIMVREGRQQPPHTGAVAMVRNRVLFYVPWGCLWWG